MKGKQSRAEQSGDSSEGHRSASGGARGNGRTMLALVLSLRFSPHVVEMHLW